MNDLEKQIDGEIKAWRRWASEIVRCVVDDGRSREWIQKLVRDGDKLLLDLAHTRSQLGLAMDFGLKLSEYYVEHDAKERHWMERKRALTADLDSLRKELKSSYSETANLNEQIDAIEASLIECKRELAVSKIREEEKAAFLKVKSKDGKRAKEDGKRAKEALDKIDAIRNSIIGNQGVSWSKHIYPLVSALKEAGYDGDGYDLARTKAAAEIELWKAKVAAQTSEQLERALADVKIWKRHCGKAQDDAISEAARAEAAESEVHRLQALLAECDRGVVLDAQERIDERNGTVGEMGWEQHVSGLRPGEKISALREMILLVPFESDEERELFFAALLGGIRSVAQVLATVMEHARAIAPNYLTIDLEGPDYGYELTIRRCEGISPANTIRALQNEVDRLRRRVAIEHSDAQKLSAVIDAARAARKYVDDTGSCPECGLGGAGGTCSWSDHAEHCHVGSILVTLDAYDVGTAEDEAGEADV